MNFLSKLPEEEEINVKEKLELQLATLSKIHDGDKEKIARSIHKSKIIETVNISRKNDSKQIFKFS